MSNLNGTERSLPSNVNEAELRKAFEKKTKADLISLLIEAEKRNRYLESRLLDFEKRLGVLENKKTPSTSVNSSEPENIESNPIFQPWLARAKELQDRVDELEQYTRRDNIVIHGLPEPARESEESLLRDIRTLFSKIDPDIGQDCLSVAHRLGRRDIAEEASRCRPVVVRFARRSDRQKIMRKKKILKDVDLSGLMRRTTATDNGRRPFITDHLSPKNRELFITAKQLQRDKKVAAVFTIDCKLCCKLRDSDRGYFVFKSADDILRKLRHL